MASHIFSIYVKNSFDKVTYDNLVIVDGFKTSVVWPTEWK